MREFRSNRSLEIIPTILTLILINLLGFFIKSLMDSYLMLSLIKVVLILCNIFYIYHIGVWFSVKYIIEESKVQITAWGGLKKVTLKVEDIKGFVVEHGKIKGIGLSGVSSNKFAIGRIAVKKLGTTRMFVTSNDCIVYLDTDNINYAVSPKDCDGFQRALNEAGIKNISWVKEYNKVHKLYKEKKFIIPLVITSIIVFIITFLPITLYVMNKLPNVMPLAINSAMTIAKIGTDKQFAFAQMLYGVLNMAVLFCMYYASHFCAKYDEKTAYRYLYVALIVASVFLYLQIVLMTMSVH